MEVKLSYMMFLKVRVSVAMVGPLQADVSEPQALCPCSRPGQRSRALPPSRSSQTEESSQKSPF